MPNVLLAYVYVPINDQRFHILAHNPNSPTPTPTLTVALIYLLSSKTLALILKTTQEVRQIDRRTIFVIGGGKKLFRSFNSVQCFWYFAFPFTHTHSYEPTTKTNKPKKQIQNVYSFNAVVLGLGCVRRACVYGCVCAVCFQRFFLELMHPSRSSRLNKSVVSVVVVVFVIVLIVYCPFIQLSLAHRENISHTHQEQQQRGRPGHAMLSKTQTHNIYNLWLTG